jgi:hypothetical protein
MFITNEQAAATAGYSANDREGSDKQHKGN